jgi:amino-acid N-acetyltransferase
MLSDSITLTSAEATEIAWLEALLEANDLPNRNLRSGPGQFFLARAEAERIGGGGLESYGSKALLRSVVIAEPHRGRGYGVALCDGLEARARTNGVETLYLLTTTADAFFREFGYEEIDREVVPPEIQETTEFADLCPQSATCMRKALDN